MLKFRVAEKFVSINGEGTRAGQLAVFIRFAGCNLKCSYCDTAWAQDLCAYSEEMSVEEITDHILSTKVKNVTLTGGEPLLRNGIEELISGLVKLGLNVEIETNGSVPLKPLDVGLRPVFTMDYKLPGSGMESQMREENFALLEKEDTVKFVCSDKNDLERSLYIMKKYELINRCNVYISCVFGSLSAETVVEFMKENCLNGVNFQLQMHKYIWDPEQKGV